MVRLCLIVIVLILFATPTRAASMYQLDGTITVRNTDAIDPVRSRNWGSAFRPFAVRRPVATACTSSGILCPRRRGCFMARPVVRERSHVQFRIAIIPPQHNRDIQ